MCSPSAANFALPPGSGYIKENYGWLPEIVANASETSVFYATFDVATHTAFSMFPRIYKRVVYAPDGNGGAVADITTVPVWTAIIDVDKGVVKSIGWDDGCFFCADNGPECVHTGLDATALDANGTFSAIGDDIFRGCRMSNSQCYSLTAPLANVTGAYNSSDLNATRPGTSSAVQLTGCDLQVFITWTGTDRNNVALKSSSKRFSRYRQYGVASAYNSALNLAADAQNIANTAITAVQSVPGRIVPAGSSGERRRLESVNGDVLPTLVLGDEVQQAAALDAAEAAQEADGQGMEARRAAWKMAHAAVGRSLAEGAVEEVRRLRAEAEAAQGRLRG